MATTIQFPSGGSLGSQTIEPAMPTTVYIKKTWDSAWTPAPYLVPQSATLGMGTDSSAVVKLNYGLLARETDDDFYEYYAQELIDRYLQIRQVTTRGQEKELFTGIVVRDQLDPHGNEVTTAAGKPVDSGDQMFHVAGLAELLRRCRIDTAKTDIGTLDYVPVINGAHGGGLRGNRSSSPEASYAVYRFSSTDGAQWTYKNVLMTALYDYAVLNDPDIEFYATGIGLNMIDQFQGKLQIDGLNMVQLLDKLIDRRRGLFWRILPVGIADDSPTITIEVGTLFKQKQMLGDTIYSGVSQVYDLDLRELGATLQGAALALTPVQKVDRIIAKGERVVSCFTVDTDQLEPAWSSTLETQYKTAASGDDGYDALSDEDKKLANDRYRSGDRFASVYRHFMLKLDWDYRDYNANPVNVIVTTNGNIKAATTATQPGYYVGDKTLLHQLPLQRCMDYTTATATDYNLDHVAPNYLSPLVWVLLDGTYVQIDRLAEVRDDLPALSVAVSNSGAGIEIGARPNYLMAKNHFSGAAPGRMEPLIYYDTMMATVAIETDQRLAVTATANAAGSAFFKYTEAAKKERKMVIDVPGACCWVVMPGTYVDVSTDGGLTSIGDEIKVLRNDRKRLEEAAAAAMAWYGIDRQTMTLKLAKIDTTLDIGQYVAGLSTATKRETLETTITQIDYDLERLSTTIKTSFVEMDFGKLAGDAIADQATGGNLSPAALPGANANGQPVGGFVRDGGSGNVSLKLAKTQEASPADNKISVKIVDGSGTEIGNAFDAYGVFVDGATTFASVTPQIDSGVLVPVYRDQGGNWRVALTLTSVGTECEEEE